MRNNLYILVFLLRSGVKLEHKDSVLWIKCLASEPYATIHGQQKSKTLLCLNQT
jgi:hypothetical protein